MLKNAKQEVVLLPCLIHDTVASCVTDNCQLVLHGREELGMYSIIAELFDRSFDLS